MFEEPELFCKAPPLDDGAPFDDVAVESESADLLDATDAAEASAAADAAEAADATEATDCELSMELGKSVSKSGVRCYQEKNSFEYSHV